MYIIPTDRLSEAGSFPLEPHVFEKKIDDICTESREKLLNEWLLKCADIFLEFRACWKSIIPIQPDDPLCIINKFFACVNSLMASQLRRLVTRSLNHFLELIVRFKVIRFKFPIAKF